MIYPPHHFEEKFEARVEHKDLPRWDVELGTMKGTVLAKARKLNKFKCIVHLGVGIYDIKPIPGYNKTTYRVNLMPESCNCQYNKKGKGKTCAHIMAVHLYKKLRSENE